MESSALKEVESSALKEVESSALKEVLSSSIYDGASSAQVSSLTHNSMFNYRSNIKFVQSFLNKKINKFGEWDAFFHTMQLKGLTKALNTQNSPMNTVLQARNGSSTVIISEIIETITQLDEAFKAAPELSDSIIVYRCYQDFMTPQSISDEPHLTSFISTSVNKFYSLQWCEPHAATGFTILIVIPKGSKGVIPLVLDDRLTNKTYQYEVLLNRNGKLIKTMLQKDGLDVFLFIYGKDLDIYQQTQRLSPELQKFVGDAIRSDVKKGGFIKSKKTRRKKKVKDLFVFKND
jgi:hypothetical protein